MNNLSQDYNTTLEILKKEGTQTLKELALALTITTEGARFQLQKLSGEGLVKSERKSQGRGRPQQIWSLTEKGHAKFPNAHAGITIKLIEKIKETLGEKALDAIIFATGDDNILKYNAAINRDASLEEKLNELASIRTEEGYMAHISKEEDGYLLVENHCPICDAAKSCQGFCKSELRTFQNVLGDQVAIERTSHILTGAKRCANKITPIG